MLPRSSLVGVARFPLGSQAAPLLVLPLSRGGGGVGGGGPVFLVPIQLIAPAIYDRQYRALKVATGPSGCSGNLGLAIQGPYGRDLSIWLLR